MLGSQLAVKVEGIVQGSTQNLKQKLARKVRAVQVTVTSQANSNVVSLDGKVINIYHIKRLLESTLIGFLLFF